MTHSKRKVSNVVPLIKLLANLCSRDKVGILSDLITFQNRKPKISSSLLLLRISYITLKLEGYLRLRHNPFYLKIFREL